MQTARTRVSGLLRAAHFRNSATRLTRTGLVFDHVIDNDERTECACRSLVNEDSARTTRVVANPEKPSLVELYRIIAEETRDSDDDALWEYGLRDAMEYPRTWEVERDRAERQTLFLVAFGKDAQPVGFARLKLYILHDTEEREIDLEFEPEYFYVIPRYRGKGFGVDLSAAAGRICIDVLNSAYRAAPAGTTIGPRVYAGFVSEGGEEIGRSIHDAIVAHQQSTMSDPAWRGARADVKLEECDYDSDW